MRWYVSQNGRTTGPLTEERLRMLLEWGKISRDAYICDEQWSAWIAIARSGFAPHLSPPDAEPPSKAEPAGEPGTEILAGLHHYLFAGLLLVAAALTVAGGVYQQRAWAQPSAASDCLEGEPPAAAGCAERAQADELLGWP